MNVDIEYALTDWQQTMREGPEMPVIADDLRRKLINAAIASCGEREASAIALRFGLFDGTERTNKEIGKSLRVSPVRAGQILNSGLHKLRHAAHLETWRHTKRSGADLARTTRR